MNSRREIQTKEKPVPRARALLSKEYKGQVGGETSFRVYYGEIGATVPFMWESQPGTPKHPNFKMSNDNIVPPLTPPPIYNSSSSSSSSTRRPRIFSIISSISRRSRSNVTPTPSLSFSSYSSPLSLSRSSSSSSSISLSSPHQSGEGMRYKAQRRSHILCSTPRVKKLLLFDDDELETVDDSPTSSSGGCFGFKKQGCSSVKGMKNSILCNKGR